MPPRQCISNGSHIFPSHPACTMAEMNPKKFRGYCANGCGRQIKKGAKTYCSVRCQHADHRRSLRVLFELGAYPAGRTNTQFLRQCLAERIGEKCSRCGWNERHPVTGRVIVEIEHIDGDWRNNRPENLTLLCPNCHALTPTFRALNWGRGRPSRRKAQLLIPARKKDYSRLRIERSEPAKQLSLGIGLPT